MGFRMCGRGEEAGYGDECAVRTARHESGVQRKTSARLMWTTMSEICEKYRGLLLPFPKASRTSSPYMSSSSSLSSRSGN